jgi:hypothetical protein
MNRDIIEVLKSSGNMGELGQYELVLFVPL